VRLPKEPTPEGVKVGYRKPLSLELPKLLYVWNPVWDLPKRLIGKVVMPGARTYELFSHGTTTIGLDILV
jgi:hypothetical protein